jgi:hypothetical protein
VGSFLKEKNDVFNMFQVFRIHVEKQLGSYIQFLCSDEGGEYILKVFHHYCQKNSICQQFTQPNIYATPKRCGIMKIPNSFQHELQSNHFYPLARFSLG